MRKSAVVFGILALIAAGGLFLAAPAQAQCSGTVKAAVAKPEIVQIAGCGNCAPKASGTSSCGHDKAEKKAAGCGGGCSSAAGESGCSKAKAASACSGCSGAPDSGCSHAKAEAHGEGHHCPLGDGLKGTFGPAPAMRGVTQNAYPIGNGLVIVHQGSSPKAIQMARKAAHEKVGTFQATCAAKATAHSEGCGGCASKLGLLRQAKAEVVETEDGAIVVITASEADTVTFLHEVMATHNERHERTSA